MKVDHIIVGQGLAGSLLAWHLLERGRRVLVVDRDEPATSSKVAAGLVTPIAGQQFSLPEPLPANLDFAKQTYWDIEEKLGQQYFHHLRIARLFKHEEEIHKWEKRKQKDRYQDFYTELKIDHDLAHADHGGIEIKKGGWLNVAAFIEGIRIYLLERLAYAIGKVNSRDIETLHPCGVKWKNITAENIIFCQGWRGTGNHYFTGIPMKNARGDILRCRSEPLKEEERILNRGGWILPLGHGIFRAGATYDHSFTSDVPQPAGKAEVREKISNIIKPDFEILSHESAVRPVIRRSEVFAGRHPVHPDILYFNGLGSKGVINAPAKTFALVEHLLENKPLDPAMDIREHFTF